MASDAPKGLPTTPEGWQLLAELYPGFTFPLDLRMAGKALIECAERQEEEFQAPNDRHPKMQWPEGWPRHRDKPVPPLDDSPLKTLGEELSAPAGNEHVDAAPLAS